MVNKCHILVINSSKKDERNNNYKKAVFWETSEL
jgi:hypothetical protein